MNGKATPRSSIVWASRSSSGECGRSGESPPVTSRGVAASRSGPDRRRRPSSPRGRRGSQATTRASIPGTLHFLVGKSLDSGGGNYIRRLDAEDETIYLTSSRVYLNTRQDDFLDKEILDVEKDQIAAIRGNGFLIEDREGSLKLAELPAGKKESAKVSQLTNLLSGLRFNKHYLADAPEVQGLAFDASVEIDLEDESGYRVAVASKDDKHYLRIQGYHTAGQLSIAVDADEEESKRVADQLQRQNETQDFNAFHGSWIYEVTETTADKVRLAASDLVEDA